MRNIRQTFKVDACKPSNTGEFIVSKSQASARDFGISKKSTDCSLAIYLNYAGADFYFLKFSLSNHAKADLNILRSF